MQTKPAPVERPRSRAVSARSRKLCKADASHQELVKARREREAAEIVGNSSDSDSRRLQLRRLQRERMKPGKLYSQRARVGSNLAVTHPEQSAAEESRLHRSNEPTADSEGGAGLERELTADTA